MYSHGQTKYFDLQRSREYLFQSPQLKEMHQNPPLKQSISWDGVKLTPGRRCLIKTRVTNCKWAFFHMTWAPVLSSLFTRGAWRDIWWLNNFLQANTSSQEGASSETPCCSVHLKHHHAQPHLSLQEQICHLFIGAKMCQKCVWQDNRFLLDALNAGFHWKLLEELKWTGHIAHLLLHRDNGRMTLDLNRGKSRSVTFV